ncbi:putative F-box protein At1g32420 [Cicer arietinum]|uniref:F-box protein At1g32420 n=1 Tax=Cicer arietinum TaxID=3827 RepID=A0A3Q7YGD2_CICAR|nr:putative F-box protein At1g32420 [Cicer arietinum]
MEKLVALTNEELKVRNKLHHIHDDLALSILSKLPLKSIKRFECVNKSWSILFENHNFMKMFRNHFLYNNDYDYGDAFILLQELPVTGDPHYVWSFYLLSGESQFHNKIKLDLPFSIDDSRTGIFILGFNSINGIICICRQTPTNLRIVLWNPTTAEFFVIPPSPEECVPHRGCYFEFLGFGYDHIRDDYKVIRHITFHHIINNEEDVSLKDRWVDTVLEVYSVSSNSWRILDIDMPYHQNDDFLLGAGVHINAMCHWWGVTHSFVDECLVSFDLINEALVTTPASLDMYEGCELGHMVRYLVVLNESISLISNYPETTTYYISILGELGVEKSWVKLFMVESIPFIDYPVGVGKKGNICFNKFLDELLWIDLSTHIIDEVGLNGQSSKIGIYKESLFSIRGINN